MILAASPRSNVLSEKCVRAGLSRVGSDSVAKNCGQYPSEWRIQEEDGSGKEGSSKVAKITMVPFERD
jgi:hypothetical protein